MIIIGRKSALQEMRSQFLVLMGVLSFLVLNSLMFLVYYILNTFFFFFFFLFIYLSFPHFSSFFLFFSSTLFSNFFLIFFSQFFFQFFFFYFHSYFSEELLTSPSLSGSQNSLLYYV